MMASLWALLKHPQAVWMVYGGGIVLLILLALIKRTIVKKKRQRIALGRAHGARCTMRKRPV